MYIYIYMNYLLPVCGMLFIFWWCLLKNSNSSTYLFSSWLNLKIHVLSRTKSTKTRHMSFIPLAIGVVEFIVGVSGISRIDWYHICCLKSAVLAIFTLWKLANKRNQYFFSWRVDCETISSTHLILALWYGQPFGKLADLANAAETCLASLQHKLPEEFDQSDSGKSSTVFRHILINWLYAHHDVEADLSMLSNISPCARCTVRSNKLKRQSLEQSQVRKLVAQAPQTQDSLKCFYKAFSKARGGRGSQGMWLACATVSDWLMR